LQNSAKIYLSDRYPDLGDKAHSPIPLRDSPGFTPGSLLIKTTTCSDLVGLRTQYRGRNSAFQASSEKCIHEIFGVIAIETSCSDMELLEAFEDFHYPNNIGPGAYDIHSPNVPSVESIIDDG